MNDKSQTEHAANAQKTRNNPAEKSPDHIQWHAGFCSAMQLELKAQWPVLTFIREYSLTKKPLAVDLLVVRKDPNVIIENELGRIFRTHNLLEYKSPDDEMGIDDYYKVLAYACLYKVDAPSENGIAAEDISISMIREGYPRKLFEFFIKKSYQVTLVSPGIYYVKKDGFFNTQIIVTKDLNPDQHIWLTSLTRHLSQAATHKLTGKITELNGKLEEDLGASVLDISIRANKKQFQNIKEEAKNMFHCPALNELFEPELQEACTQARNEGLNKGLSEGRTEGRADQLKTIIRKKLLKNKSAEVIAAELEEDDIDKIHRLIDEISKENATNTVS